MEKIKLPNISNLNESLLDAVDGVADPLALYVALYRIQKEVQDAIDQIKDMAIDARGAYGKENPVIGGFIIEKMQPRASWNYNHIQSWVIAEANKKRIENMAKKACESGSYTDPETGEVIPAAECSYTKETIKLTYKG